MSIILSTILCPIIGFFLLIFLKKLFNKKILFFIGFFSLFISFLSSLFCLYLFNKLNKKYFLFNIWNLISIDKFKFDISFLLDELSLSMLIMITGIGILIYSFSYWYMHVERELIKFFSYINLFISSMSILVLANNFLLIYFGWESVGICSYLLVSFYNKDVKNVFHSMKSFLISKISDVFFLISILLIYFCFHTFNIVEIFNIIKFDKSYENLYLIKLICMFLLLSSISKSAQYPFHTWLPNAMVGPTPASALIHSATMVTSGVYLISRLRNIFLLYDNIFYLLCLIGSFSIIFGSMSAIFNKNIKNILAYSTISQIGYMFLSIGVKAWNCAIFHLISHAIFKSLIFISSCYIILYNNNEQNIFKISFQKKKNVLVYFSFLIGLLSLMSFPIITLGFYSKGEILYKIIESKNYVFFLIAVFGAILTTLYTSRLIFNIFKTKNKLFKTNLYENFFHDVPILILMIISTFFGIFIIPDLSNFFSDFFIKNYFYILLEIVFSLITVFTIFLYFSIFTKKIIFKNCSVYKKIYIFLEEIFKKDLYFNSFYNVLEKLYNYFSSIFYKDIYICIIYFISKFIKYVNKFFLLFHSGNLQTYILIFFVISTFIFTLIIM
ncbi:NADH-quinone oxidoreductase subunit 5 family protein [Buchnera aphidicola]|uniref:NADH-quinone oxidoreductase subunit 5 family protein n=1 Tax=Buchnera aphidicola TaxID=9 RepID=UPI0031B88F5A